MLAFAEFLAGGCLRPAHTIGRRVDALIRIGDAGGNQGTCILSGGAQGQFPSPRRGGAARGVSPKRDANFAPDRARVQGRIDHEAEEYQQE